MGQSLTVPVTLGGIANLWPLGKGALPFFGKPYSKGGCASCQRKQLASQAKLPFALTGKSAWPGAGKGTWFKQPYWAPTPGGGLAKQYPPGTAGIPYAFYPGVGLVQ